MKPDRIISAQAIDDHTLIVKFSNNELRKYDISKLLEIPMFSPLKNPPFFRNFTIDPHGYGLIWNEDIDLSEYELWQNSVTLTDDHIVSDLKNKHCATV
jgi:hypothetical protein